MARIDVSMFVAECSCGGLHEIVYSYIDGVGDSRYRCPMYGIRSFFGTNSRTVTLGLQPDPKGKDGREY